MCKFTEPSKELNIYGSYDTVVVGGGFAGVAAALAAVNSYTAPIIAKQKEEKTQLAIEAVLPGGGEAVEFEDATGMVTALYASDSGWAVSIPSMPKALIMARSAAFRALTITLASMAFS